MKTQLSKAYLSKPYLAAFTLAALLLAVSPVRAQTRTVTLNTGLLNGAGTFYVEFGLFNGGGAVGDGNSIAAISNFSLTGGTLGTILPPTTGDVLGDLGTALVLKDDNVAAAGDADFAQAFTVTSSASTLTFNMNLAATSVDPGMSDDFLFQILDSSLNPLATTGPNGTELVNANYNSLSPAPIGYITVDTTTHGAGVDTGFKGIQAKINTTPVPEASTTAGFGLLLALGAAVLALSARRRKTSPLN